MQKNTHHSLSKQSPRGEKKPYRNSPLRSTRRITRTPSFLRRRKRGSKPPSPREKTKFLSRVSSALFKNSTNNTRTRSMSAPAIFTPVEENGSTAPIYNFHLELTDSEKNNHITLHRYQKEMLDSFSKLCRFIHKQFPDDLRIFKPLLRANAKMMQCYLADKRSAGFFLSPYNQEAIEKIWVASKKSDSFHQLLKIFRKSFENLTIVRTKIGKINRNVANTQKQIFHMIYTLETILLFAKQQRSFNTKLKDINQPLESLPSDYSIKLLTDIIKQLSNISEQESKATIERLVKIGVKNSSSYFLDNIIESVFASYESSDEDSTLSLNLSSLPQSSDEASDIEESNSAKTSPQVSPHTPGEEFPPDPLPDDTKSQHCQPKLPTLNFGLPFAKSPIETDNQQQAETMRSTTFMH